MPEQTDQATHKQFNDPVSVAKRSKQKIHLVEQCDKAAMLSHIIKKGDYGQAVVITKTKRGADALSTYLEAQSIKAAAIHGNKSTRACEAAAKAFSAGEVNILIATDMIFQSLNLTHIAHIISYDLPTEPEHYFSRLGCMSETGQSISFVSPEEYSLLYTIERIMKDEIPQEEVEGFLPTPEADADRTPQRTKNQKKKPRHRVQRRKTGSKTKEK